MLEGKTPREAFEYVQALGEREKLEFLVTLAHEADEFLLLLAEQRAAGNVDDETAALVHRDMTRLQELSAIAYAAGSMDSISDEVRTITGRMFLIVLTKNVFG